MGKSLTEFLRPLVKEEMPMGDICDLARHAGYNNYDSIRAITSLIRRKELGLANLPPWKCPNLPERVENYIQDVAREFQLAPSEIKRRMLTNICDDDLAYAVLGDPPRRKKSSSSPREPIIGPGHAIGAVSERRA